MKSISFKLFFTIFFICSLNVIFGQRKTSTPKQLTSASLKSGAFIDVNAASYAQSSLTIDQLIKNVLITGGNTNCATPNVSNVQVSPNLAATNTERSWGYFNKGTTNFPFNDGIILTTGQARKAGNFGTTNTLSDNLSTNGDSDLASALGVSNASLNDATYIQFDFVPSVATLTFKYIFASEEYEDDYPCSFTDGFALLLKKVSDPSYTNLAVLPSGAGAVSVTNIHPAIPGGCQAKNAQYFAGYNTSNIETNFNGRTIPLTATATVVPGQTYRFKMVLADNQDNEYDSGVFLQAGSFNIGVQITGNNGLPLPSNINICDNAPQILTATSQVAGATYQWFLNGIPINQATNSTYTATQSGTYSVEVSVPGSICPGTAQVVVTSNPSPTVQNSSLSVCSSGNTGTFNLTTAQTNISTTAGATFSFYQNLADANAQNTNTISNPTNYVSGNSIVYVLVKSNNCSNIAQLQLNVNPNPATPTISASSNTICNGGMVTLTSSSSSGNLWSTGATTQSITINTAGTYTLTNSIGSCTSNPASVIISLENNPNLQISGNLVFCEGGSTTLIASSTSNGTTYSWSNGTTGANNTVTAAGTYTVTAITSAGCQYQQNVTVTTETPPIVQNSSLTLCSSNTTANFDLTSAQASISTTPGITFSFYQNLADANAGNNNTILNPNNYNSGNSTVYVLVRKGLCAVVANLQLNITQSITPTITPSSTQICGTGSVTLSSNYSTGNTWSTGATTQSITITTPGTYTLTNTIGNCTGAPATINITGDPDPLVQISGNLTLCSNPLTLTASATGMVTTYLWSNGTTGNTISVNTPGNYTVTATTASGCQFQKTVTVVQGQIPVVQNSVLNQCSSSTNSTFDLTIAQNSISTSSGITFTYYQNQADAIAQNNNFINNISNFTSGTATIFVLVKTNSCYEIAELQLNVNTIPTPVISQSAPAICANTPVTLTSNYPNGNLWSTGETTQSISVAAAGTYTLTTTIANCTSLPVSVTLVANANPNVQISGNLNFCQGSSTTLTATANGTGNTFLWSNGTTGNTNNVTNGGTYTVTVTTSGGCQFQNSVNVTMDPQVTINIATPQQLNCVNSQVTINASGSIYQPGATFLWTTTGGGNIVSGANTLTPIVNSAGIYTLTITSATPNGCSAQSSVNVIKDIAPPTIGLSASSLTICNGQSVVLTATGGATYNWTGLTGNGALQTVSPTATTTYTVTGIGINGCEAVNSASVTINVVPAITSTLTNGKLCKGDILTLNAGTGPNYTYQWSTGATSPTINVSLPGTYTVIINNGVCSKTFSSVVSYTIVPEFTEIKFENKTLTIDTTNPESLPLEYSIDNGFNWQTSNIFYNVGNNLSVTILVRNQGIKCYNSIYYFTFHMQNSITPNGDGKNDVLDFSEISQYEGFGGNIVDRYGKIIFKPSKTNIIWNGTYLNGPLPTGTYWYQIFWKDPISLKLVNKSGWILLKNRE